MKPRDHGRARCGVRASEGDSAGGVGGQRGVAVGAAEVALMADALLARWLRNGFAVAFSRDVEAAAESVAGADPKSRTRAAPPRGIAMGVESGGVEDVGASPRIGETERWDAALEHPGESVGEHVLTEPIDRLPTGPAEASAPFGVSGDAASRVDPSRLERRVWGPDFRCLISHSGATWICLQSSSQLHLPRWKRRQMLGTLSPPW
jgi:hypothetical protein